MSGRGCGPSLPPAGIPEAEALALRLEDVAAVREAVEGGSREPLAAEDLGPLLEGQVRGHDQALAFIGRAQDVEEQFGPRLPGRHVAEFVEDQEVELLELLAEPEELLLFPGLE